MKIFVFILCFFTTFILSAQMVVESPETDALLATQMLLINELAIENKSAETERFIEYLGQFAEVVAAIKKRGEEAAKMLKIAEELKNKSAKEWLDGVESGLAGVFPEMSDFVNSAKDKVASVAETGGKYRDYVAGWGSRLSEYHDELLKNYGNHMVFPELFPAVTKMGKDFIHGENAQKIVHKAWLESGMEYEMKNDAVRGKMFAHYYEEYLNNAKNNNNIEALGLANLMQSAYISVETLEHIRKNLDLQVMKEQFNRDSAESYMEYLKESIGEKKKKESIFGL